MRGKLIPKVWISWIFLIFTKSFNNAKSFGFENYPVSLPFRIMPKIKWEFSHFPFPRLIIFPIFHLWWLKWLPVSDFKIIFFFITNFVCLKTLKRIMEWFYERQDVLKWTLVVWTAGRISQESFSVLSGWLRVEKRICHNFWVGKRKSSLSSQRQFKVIQVLSFQLIQIST